MKMHILPISDDGTSLMTVQVNEEIIIEVVPLDQMYQRVMNYASLVSFSVPHMCEECDPVF
jgi:hypothetical protein